MSRLWTPPGANPKPSTTVGPSQEPMKDIGPRPNRAERRATTGRRRIDFERSHAVVAAAAAQGIKLDGPIAEAARHYDRAETARTRARRSARAARRRNRSAR